MTLLHVDAQDGHGFGQGIDGFLMFACLVQGLSFCSQLFYLGQLLGAEGGVRCQGIINLLHVYGAVEGDGAPGEEQGCQQQHESHLYDLLDGIPLRIAREGLGHWVEPGKKQRLP